tara:strand:- start:6267 stop:6986 length:720 start_codon:yes stop_codon:yes gene_type:complete
MSEAWTRKEGKNPKGGLNEKGRKSYEAANPGSDLKAPQPKGGKRKKSFCARMGGMKSKLTSAKTANDPDSRINKSLRKWNCKDGGMIEYKKGGKTMEKFKPHMMYGDGKAKKANTNEEHLSLKKKGWKHSKPKMQDGGYLKGKSHKKGGIAAVIGGQEPVELEGGEYIIKKSTVDKLGVDTLDAINQGKMKMGGKVMKERFPKEVRMMEYGGEVSISNDKASAGDIHTTHSHSGYKAGE